jgi:alpha,alpha-trehalase
MVRDRARLNTFDLIMKYNHIVCSAAYQVGLSFLTTHMRRAVAACTSPEVFFGRAVDRQTTTVPTMAANMDPLGLAMESLSLGLPTPGSGTIPSPY